MPNNSRDRDLNADLAEQLAFLRTSCDAFDVGTLAESKRIAVTIRVLVHDTERSRSLLAQLGSKESLRWSDSAPIIDNDPTVAARSPGLTGMGAAPQGITFLSRDANQIRTSSTTRYVDFDEWWTRPVIVDSKGTQFSRRQLILALANKDGGAHIDRLQASTFALIHENSAGWVRTGGGNGIPEPVPTPVYASVRTVGEELFITLSDAGYLAPKSTVAPEQLVSISIDNFKAGEAGPTPIFDERATGNSSVSFAFDSLPGATVEVVRCADQQPDPVSGLKFPAGWMRFSVRADKNGQVLAESGSAGPVPDSTPPDDFRSTIGYNAVDFVFDNFPEATFHAERLTTDRFSIDAWGSKHIQNAGWVGVHVTLGGATWVVGGFAGPSTVQ